MLLILLLLLSDAHEVDTKGVECATACRIDGRADGYYDKSKQSCACIEYFDYKKFVRVRAIRRIHSGDVRDVPAEYSISFD